MIGGDYDFTGEDARRDAMTIIIGILAWIVLLCVAAGSWIKGDVLVGWLDFSVSIVVAALLLVFRFTGYKQACRYASVAMMYCLYLYLFLSGAAGGTTYMWHYTFPFFAIFLLGSNHGTAASLLLFFPVFINVIQDALTPGSGYYSVHFAIRFVPSVSVALSFAYLFEKERERFRKEVLRTHREQERIIEERTRQLNDKVSERDRIARKLRQSQKMEAIGTMASGVAHDLNNILSGIVSYPQLMRFNLPVDSPLLKHVTSIEQLGFRAAAVVNDLLAIARNAASVREVFDINLLIKDLLNSPEWATLAARHPRVRLKVDLGTSAGIVHCSQTRIRKCLLNLFLNGIEATSPEGTVVISTRNMPGNEDHDGMETTGPECREVTVTVRDNGPGIAEEHLDHIFEPFYTTKKMGKSGSGLGLSVVWKTVEDHEGSISVENMNPGVKFEIRLPVTASELPADQDQTLSGFEAYKGTGKILVVDDEAHLREIAEEVVQKLGYSVTTVASGEDALAHIKNNHVDLVLLDMHLGDGIGGFETYKEMIKLKPGQKAVIVSGYSTCEDVRRTMELGAFSIIMKPYSIGEIGRVIKECLGSDSTNQAAQ